MKNLLEITKKERDEIRQEWISALKSGKFNQGKSHLCDEHGNYCCLGVLCELLHSKGYITKSKNTAGQVLFENCSSILPEIVMKSLGFFTEEGANVNQYTGESLVDLNDYLDKSFEEIAVALESGDYFND